MNRRQFTKLWGVAVIALTTSWSFVLEGCASFAQISGWVVTGLDSFQSVLDLLVGQGIIMVTIGSAIDLIIKAVKAAIGDIGTAVDNYNAAPATTKASLLGKISDALIAAENEIGQFWNDLMIPDAKIASTVSGLLGLIVSTLSGFLSSLPAATTQRKTFAKALPRVAAPKTLGAYKKSFNAILEGNGYSQYKRF